MTGRDLANLEAASGTVFFKARRYRLYPSAEQAARLEGMMWRLRDLWNDAAGLVEHTRYWQRFAGWSRSFPLPKRGHIWRIYKEIKTADPVCDLARLPSATVGALSVAFDLAMQEGWKAVKAGQPPRWPRRKRLSDPLPSLEFPVWVGPTAGKRHCNVKFGKDSIRFPDARGIEPLGRIGYRRHQKLVGRPKTARILCEAGRWYCAVSCEVPLRERPRREGVVALHMGIAHNVTTSDGAVLTLLPPATKARMERRVKKAQRRLARARRSSNRRKRIVADLKRINARIAAARRARQHDIAASITARAGTVVMERLQVARMTRSAKGTTDAPGEGVAWKAARTREFLAVAPFALRLLMEQKLARSGGRLALVDPMWDSSACARCGHVDPGSRLGALKFVCTACGHAADADLNAAEVLLQRRLAGLVTGPRETGDDAGIVRVRREPRSRQNPIVRASMPRGGGRKSPDTTGGKTRRAKDLSRERSS